MWRSQKRTLSTTIQLSSVGRRRTPRFQPHINTWGVGTRDFNKAQLKHDPRYKDLVNFEYIRNANPELRRKQVTQSNIGSKLNKTKIDCNMFSN